MRRPPFKAWLASMAESGNNLPDTRQFGRFISHYIRHHMDPAVRYMCAHYAGYCSFTKQLQSVLRQCAEDQDEHPLVRGQCLESLSHQASWKRSKLRDKKVGRTIMRCLRDPNANVRFWACFATAHLRMHEATPILKSLTQDSGVGSMGWTVAYEAGETLKYLKGQPAWQEQLDFCPSPGTNFWPSFRPFSP